MKGSPAAVSLYTKVHVDLKLQIDLEIEMVIWRGDVIAHQKLLQVFSSYNSISDSPSPQYLFWPENILINII